MQHQEINENCGCGASSNPTEVVTQTSFQQDPNVGKLATVIDGRSGTINDSIRNSRGEVIGYVLNNERGTFRVFKDKVSQINESEGAMASLDAVPGMGEVQPPTRDSIGSGDQFPSLTMGTPAAKGGKNKKSKNSSNPVMGWNEFRKNMLKNQG